MSNFFGIYVGNSTASIAIYKEEGKVDVIANENGDRVTPATVSVSAEDKVVGLSSVSFSKASSTVMNNKRLLDTELTPEDLETYISESSVSINSENGPLYVITESEKRPVTLSPLQVAVLIFKKLYNIGVGACGQKELSCVLCTPRSWNPETRRLVLEAAQTAGWTVLQLINEAPAALLAYRIGYEKPPRDIFSVVALLLQCEPEVLTPPTQVVVYRLGGVSCEASVLSVTGGLYSVLSAVRAPTGGNLILAALTNHLVEEFSRKYYLDPRESRKSLFKFRSAAKAILHTLSTIPSCSQFIESACEGVDFNASVSVARLNSLLTPLLPTFAAPVHAALREAQLSSTQISKVILCGGCLKVPKIRDYVSSFFECDSLYSISPDEVLACGAAEQAGLLLSTALNGAAALESSATLPFLAHPLLLKCGGEELKIEKTVIPLLQQFTLQPMEEPLEILAEQGSLKGKANMEPIDASSGLELNVKINLHGEVHLEAVNPTSNETLNGFVDFQVD